LVATRNRFQQETPREQQDMTRSWDAVEIPRGLGGGLEMSRSKESDTNEYGFGRGFKEIVREVIVNASALPSGHIVVLARAIS
jgi:hypothetical protein